MTTTATSSETNPEVKDEAKAKDPAKDPVKNHSALIKRITKEFGDGAIQQGNSDRLRPQVDTISTGSLSLDIATGIGGIPRGRIVEIYGPESAGKSTLSIHIMAEALRRGGSAAYIDAEQAMDPDYARNCGLDVDRLLISQPDYGEQALNILDRIISDGSVDVVVVDSVASLVPEAEVEQDIGHQRIGLQAKLMSESLRKLTPKISKSRTAVVFINQLRDKIGTYGNPETTPGGRALKFYASMRIDLRARERIKDGDEYIGNRIRARVVKNKVAPPYRHCEFDIIFNAGIRQEDEIMPAGEHLGVITRTGNTYHYNGEKLGVGKGKAEDYIRSEPELAKQILDSIRERMLYPRQNPLPPDGGQQEE